MLCSTIQTLPSRLPGMRLQWRRLACNAPAEKCFKLTGRRSSKLRPVIYIAVSPSSRDNNETPHHRFAGAVYLVPVVTRG